MANHSSSSLLGFFLNFSISSPFKPPKIVLDTLFSKTLNFCIIRDRVQHLQKTGAVVVWMVLSFVSLESRLDVIYRIVSLPSPDIKLVWPSQSIPPKNLGVCFPIRPLFPPPLIYMSFTYTLSYTEIPTS